MAELSFLLVILEEEKDACQQLESDHELFILSNASFMRQSLNRIQGYFEVRVRAYFGDKFQCHF